MKARIHKTFVKNARFSSLSPKYILNHKRACGHPDSCQVWLLSQEAPPGDELDMKPKMEEEEEVFEEEEAQDDKDDIKDFDDPGDLDPGDLDQDFAEEPLIAVPGKRFV